MYALLNKARKEGLMSLEADVEDPGKESDPFEERRLPQGSSRA